MNTLTQSLLQFRTALLELFSEAWRNMALPPDVPPTFPVADIYTEYIMGGGTVSGPGPTVVAGFNAWDTNAALNQLQMAHGVFNGLIDADPTQFPSTFVANGLLNGPNPASDIFTKFLPNNQAFPWMLNVYILQNSHLQYNPYFSDFRNGWIGTSDVLAINIPLPPANSVDFSGALMAYYQQFNTIFGTDYLGTIPTPEQNPSPPIAGIVNKCIPYLPDIQKFRNAANTNTLETLGDGGPEQMLAFQAVLMEMIASAWVDQNYWNYLTTKFVVTPNGTPQAIYKDQYVTFQNPWAFTITFNIASNSPAPIYCPPTPNTSGVWKNLPCNQLFIHFPNPPTTNMKMDENAMNMWPLALARYNDTGPEFPLTCC
jgi:ribosomally synthesized peptide (two-chain TOMM family)